VFKLALRQTEGFMTSIARIMHAAIAIPDFSCISKRTVKLPVILLTKAMEPGSVVIVDSTGLKVYGKDEWHQEKHAAPARRTWRKLHLAIDEHHQVLASDLTTPEVGDSTAVVDLLAQITTAFDAFIGGGAYDGEPVSQVVLAQQPDAKVVIPPHKTAVRSEAGDPSATSISKTSRKMGASHGNEKPATTYEAMLNLRCNGTSAFSAAR
jgi:hypothetical protein